MAACTPAASPPTRSRHRRGRTRRAAVGSILVGLVASLLPGAAVAQTADPTTPLFPVVRLDVDCETSCTSASIAEPNTSRKVAVAPDGTIYATFRANEGIFVTHSTDRGETFAPAVRVSTTSAQPALAVSSGGTPHVAWATGGTAYLTRALADGWSTPVEMGDLWSSNLQLAVDGDHVYAVDQQGTTLLRSTDAGASFTTTTVSASSWVFADVHVDPLTRDVYVVVDNPSVAYYRSTDRGATFSAVTNVAASVYYSVGALTSTPAGPLAYFAGSGTNLERIDLTTGTATQTTVASSDMQSRSLGADAFGNVVVGSVSGGQLRFEVSQDRGATFAAPISLGDGQRANAAINTTVGDVMFLHQTSAGVHLAVYGGLLAGYGVTLDVTALSYTRSEQSLTVTVTNTSDQDLPVDEIHSASPFFNNHTCGTVLAAGTDCTITVTMFWPGNGFLTVDIGGFVRTIPLTYAPGEAPPVEAPTFSEIERLADGFRFEITNYDPTLGYGVGRTEGWTSSGEGNVAVRGLEPGQSSTVTVTVSNGARQAEASITGSALDLLVEPTFGSVQRDTDGFQVTIENFDETVTYELLSTAGTATIDDEGTIRVSGLEPGQSAEVTVDYSRDGAVGGSVLVEGIALDRLDTPTFGVAERTVDGFVVAIGNLDPDQTYVVTSDVGVAELDDDGIVTVTGLTPGQSATLTVTTTREGAAASSTTLTLNALDTLDDPTVAAVQRTVDGFTVQLDPVDPDATYTVTTEQGVAVIDEDGRITVTGLAPSQQTTVTITVTKDGHAPATATVDGRALDELPAPNLGEVQRTTDGFVVTVADHDPSLTYEATTDRGVVTVGEDGTITLTGLAPGESASVTLVVTRDGAAPVTVTIVAAALDVIAEPSLGTVQRTVDGFTVAITDRDPGTTYTVTSDRGTVVLGADGTISVTGLSPSETATVTLELSRVGAVPTVVTVDGAALDQLPAPTFGEPRATVDGFTIAITDHDPSLTYEATATYGTVTVRPDGTIVVTGLPAGGSSIVTVTVTRDGAAPQVVTVSGTSLPSPTRPLPEAGSDRLPVRGSGEGSVTVDGREVRTSVTRGRGQATVSGGGASVQLRFSGPASATDGPMQVRSDARTSIHATGFLADSTVTFWVLGVEAPVGTGTVGADGEVDLTNLRLPASVRACTHTVQVTGLTAQGAPIGLNLGITLVPTPYPFGDVPDGFVHAANIACAEAQGIVRGIGDGAYLPTGGLQRGQFASMLARALDLEPGSNGASFSDVRGNVHADAIAAVEAAGFIRGFGDGTFRPQQVITRGQVASILAAASGLDGVADGPFADVDGSAHAGAVNALVGTGVVSGYADGTFGVQDAVTRAQAASLMVRYLGR